MPQERAYQTKDREMIEKAWTEFRSVLYQLPTGGGKSIVFTGIINDNKSERQIIFAHKRRLITQLEEHLKNLGITPGVLQGARKENLNNQVIIASIRTAVKDRNLEQLLKTKWDRVYIDEARHSRTGSYDKVLQSFAEVHPEHKLLGVDATPYRKDKKRLDKWFQAMVVSSENVKSLQEDGYLAKVRTYATPLGDIKEEVKEVAGDYQQQELSDYMRKPKYLNYVVSCYQKRGEDRQALVFAVDKKHATALAEVFRANGIKNVATVSSDNSEEEVDKIMKDYEEGRTQVLINIEMLTEGVDLPETKCIIGARPTKSLVLYLQIVGRGTRPKNDNGDCIVLDCCGWTEEFGTVDSPKHWSLNPEIDPNNPRKKNRIVGKKEDGTFTDEPGEFDELVEMTPEEYMRHLSGGIEKAEKYNMTVDEQIKEIKLRLIDLFNQLPDKKFRPDFSAIMYEDNDNFTIVVEYVLIKLRSRKRNNVADDLVDRYDKGYDWRTPVAMIKLGHDRPIYATLKTSDDDFDTASNGQQNYVRTAMLMGNLNEELMDAKSKIKQYIEAYDEILDLKKSKVNIKEIQEAAKRFEEEENQKKAQLHAKSGEWFELPHTLSEDDFFKVDRFNSGTIIAIKIMGEQINGHHNKVMLKLKKSHYDYNKHKHVTETNEVEKQYVKGERFWEMLKAGQWKHENPKHEKAIA